MVRQLNGDFIFRIFFILVNINSDEDCWSMEKNNTVDRSYATLVRFAPKIAYGKHSCAVHVMNPWTRDMQNGFGVFLSRKMDCSSTVTVDCLSDEEDKPSSVQLTCHTSENRVEIPCNAISLSFKRKLGSEELKMATVVQVVALAKGT